MPSARGRARARAAALLLAVVATPVFAARARADHIRTLEGDASDEVVAIEGDGDALVVKTASRSVPVADVKEVVFPAAERDVRPAPTRVFVATGDELAGEVVAGDGDKLTLRSGSLGPVDLRLDLVRAVALTGDELDLRRFRKDVLPVDPKQDVIVTRAWTSQPGTVEKIDAKGVVFKSEAIDTVALGPEKIVGARLAPLAKPPEPPAGLRARLDLADGSAVLGKLRAYRGGVFTIDAAWKPGLAVRGAEVRSLSFLGGRIAYLSDLPVAEAEEHAKVISLVFKHREDANVMGNPLRVDGKSYRKGLGVHAFSRLAYKLDGGFSRFRAVIGLDDEARERRDALGTLRFQVLVDGKPALGEHGVLLSTRDPATPVDVDVTGASVLTLVADFGESQDTLARGAWADAYLVKK